MSNYVMAVNVDHANRTFTATARSESDSRWVRDENGFISNGSAKLFIVLDRLDKDTAHFEKLAFFQKMEHRGYSRAKNMAEV